MSLINKILKEVGDLKSINPFIFKKVNSLEYIGGEDSANIFIKLVFVDKGYEADFRGIFPGLIEKLSTIYEVEFSVNDKASQAFKSDMKTYFRVLKTVSLMVGKFIEANKPDVLIFTGSEKGSDDGSGNNDNIKSKMYKNIVINHLTQYPKYKFCEKEMPESYTTSKQSVIFNSAKNTLEEITTNKPRVEPEDNSDVMSSELIEKVLKEAAYHPYGAYDSDGEPTGDRYGADGKEVSNYGKQPPYKKFYPKTPVSNSSTYVSFKKDRRPTIAIRDSIGLTPDAAGKLRFFTPPTAQQLIHLKSNGGFVLKAGDEKFATRNPFN